MLRLELVISIGLMLLKTKMKLFLKWCLGVWRTADASFIWYRRCGHFSLWTSACQVYLSRCC